MKISIVTVSFNSEQTIQSTLKSVQGQTYENLEHLIIDGASTDRTLKIVKEFERENLSVISEPDRGIYDAMNKGIAKAKGDIIGFLNADDYFARSDAIELIVQSFNENPVDCVFGNVVFVNSTNLQRIKRFYPSPRWFKQALRFGHMPPHPATYVRRSRLLEIGGFNISFRIAADFDLLVRLLWNHKVPSQLLPKILVVMRTGGVSALGFRNTSVINAEMVKSCRNNGLLTHPILIWGKYLFKWTQMIWRPRHDQVFSHSWF